VLMLWQPYLKVFQIFFKMKKTLITIFYDCFFKHLYSLDSFFKIKYLDYIFETLSCKHIIDL